MSSFDVRVFAIRRRPGRKAFEVRWWVAGRDKWRSFVSRALADGYRAELIRAARKGLAFAPGTGEPEAWAAPAPEPVTWYRHAVAYAEMKWPHLAPHSRASLADALATVTTLLARGTGSRPPAQILRAALYGHAFNARRRSGAPTPDTASALAWMERASLPVSQLSDPHIIRAALDGLCTRLDGSPATASTITRKRAVFHGALGYAVELGLLPVHPIGLVRWRAPRAASAVSPATVPSPAQVRVILAEVARIRLELAAFFGCLYYAALRPEEAVAPRRADLVLPARGRGTIILTAACPRTGAAWTSTGTPFEPRGLKHRPGATGAPAEVAARAGNSARVLQEVYLHCTDGQDDRVSQRIEDALDAGTGITHSPPGGKASGYTHRRHHPRPCPLYVREPVPGPAHSPRPSGPADPQHRMQTLAVTSVFAGQAACEVIPAEAGRCPDLAHA